ncbi:MAG: hypothetical protein AAF709_16385, partial [Pseudomonadota bacterium]
PWLNHIQEDLGYVLLDTNVLERPDVISDFETGLAALSFDLRTGHVSPNTSRWSNLTNDMRQQSAYVQRMQSVIRGLQSAISLSR